MLSNTIPKQRDAAAAALGSAGCALNDTACICKSQAFQDAITTTILQSCSASDVQGTYNTTDFPLFKEMMLTSSP